jgi:inhibitor of KinA
LYKYHRVGEKAIEIRFSNATNELWTWKKTITTKLQQEFENQIAVNEGYESILILIVHDKLSSHDVISKIPQLLDAADAIDKVERRTWKLPIYYQEQNADLQHIADYCTLTTDHVIEKHLCTTYQIEFMGFLPGFPYLSGLDEALSIPRKQTPTRSVAAGSVAIAAGQCGIYPMTSPGGWYVLGECPLRFFNVDAASPCFLAAGDLIRFERIHHADFTRIQQEPFNPKDYCDD